MMKNPNSSKKSAVAQSGKSQEISNECLPLDNSKGEIVLYQPDETISLEVRMEDETVWLTQQQMADLFDKDRTDIGRHIRNIYKEEELEKDITCAKFAHMGSEGDQHYEYTAYNLDGLFTFASRLTKKTIRKNPKFILKYLSMGIALLKRKN